MGCRAEPRRSSRQRLGCLRPRRHPARRVPHRGDAGPADGRHGHSPCRWRPQRDPAGPSPSRHRRLRGHRGSYRHHPGITIRRPDEHDHAYPPAWLFDMRSKDMKGWGVGVCVILCGSSVGLGCISGGRVDGLGGVVLCAGRADLGLQLRFSRCNEASFWLLKPRRLWVTGQSSSAERNRTRQAVSLPQSDMLHERKRTLAALLRYTSSLHQDRCREHLSGCRAPRRDLGQGG